MDAQSRLPSGSLVLFARGVLARLATWSTLRAAVQEGWGGPKSAEKRRWLASEIVDIFEEQSAVPDDQYIEELLLQVMADEFDVTVEDGSAESVAKDIVKLWDQTQNGNQEFVLKLEEIESKLQGKQVDIQQGVTSDDEEGWTDEDEEGDEEEEVPQLVEPQQERPKELPEVDEDGFTVVKRKTKHR